MSVSQNPADLQLVEAALKSLGELIDACATFQLAGAEHPNQSGVQLGPFQRVKSCVAVLSHYATSRLDDLCAQYLLSRPGDWSTGLLDAIRDPIRLDKDDGYESELRRRRNQLSKLAIILENDQAMPRQAELLIASHDGQPLGRPAAPEEQSDAGQLIEADTQEKRSEARPTGGSTEPTRKRSTERGEGRAKLIAALTKHHRYANGGCLNLEPIGNNELARLAGVWPSTASAFFNDKFQGHAKYKVLCRDAGKLGAALKLLNDEFAPYLLLGAASADLAAPEEGDTDAE